MSNAPISSALSAMRRDYAAGALREAEADPNPHVQLTLWLEQAIAAQVHEPNAMALATVGADGSPSARMVLLKGHDERGLRFFTNLRSRKAQELAQRPAAALLFYWGELERQIRIIGTVIELSREESAEYFRQRPRGSQLGAWASPQSEVVSDRADLEARFATMEQRFAGDEPDLPPHWGGYLLTPREFEFWQGQRNRLHDRLLYTPNATGGWTIQRLAP